jgi:hypothetical protein
MPSKMRFGISLKFLRKSRTLILKLFPEHDVLDDLNARNLMIFKRLIESFYNIHPTLFSSFHFINFN